MDELRAYTILGLEPGASREEIKEAYARLSKEFHPEEYPEEFKQIHEAYRLLGRAARGGRRGGNPEVSEAKPEESRQETKQTARTVKIGFEEKEPKPVERYDFEETLHKAQQTEAERLHEMVLRAEAEFSLLIQPANRNKVKMFTAFFRKEEYQEAIRSREFAGKLAVLIEESDLKKKVYRDMVSFYRLQDKEPANLVPEGQALYFALNKKVDIKKEASAAKSVVPIGVAAGLWAGIRPFARMFDQVGMAMLFIAFAASAVWIYVACMRKWSHVLAQIVAIIYINIFLFVAGVGDIWTAAVGGEEAMVSIIAGIWIISCVWLAVLGIYMVIRLIKNKVKKK